MHHLTNYADCPQTNIDGLTLACGPHHKLVTSGGWPTRKTTNGATQWMPPPHQDRGQPRTNTYHHPEKLLRPTTKSTRSYERWFSFSANRRFTGSGRSSETSPPSMATSLASEDETNE